LKEESAATRRAFLCLPWVTVRQARIRPSLTDPNGHMRNFSRVAFETDMPRIEFATNPPCQRHLSNPRIRIRVRAA